MIRIIPVILLLICTLPVDAAPDIEEFRKIPVILKGRPLPLDTYAINILRQLSGKSKYEKMSAARWLAETMFKPEKAAHHRVFLISNPDIPGAIGIKGTGKGRDRYSYNQLIHGAGNIDRLVRQISSKSEASRSLLERDIILLYNRLLIYKDLRNCMMFAIPSPHLKIESPELQKITGARSGVHSYLQFRKTQKILENFINESPEDSRELREASRLLAILKSFPEFYGATTPPFIPSASGDWKSPWTYLAEHNTGNGAPPLIKQLEQIVLAYRNGDNFNRIVTKFIDSTDSIIQTDSSTIRNEVLYNSVDPFYKAQFFYGIAALLLLLSSLFRNKKPLFTAGMILTSGGFLLHLWGVAIRYTITGRPPVTNLYETFIFTGLITVVLGGFLYFRLNNTTSLIGGNVTALIMMLIAGRYSLDGDTMGVLVAVLDSNFWLAAHVITIILGYAGIILSGFTAHVWLVKNLRGIKDSNLFKAVFSTQVFGLIFTFTGTVLGGVWADQSWGRFWGWDPKENGALAVLIFSAILFHAKKAGMIKEKGFAAGSVAGAVMVALAWFGVNLLGVGLHSYGFTSGVAIPLFVYVTAELLFIVSVTIPGEDRKK